MSYLTNNSKKIVTTLAIICLILTVGMLGAMGEYFSVNSTLQDQIQINNALQSDFNNYKDTHQHNDIEFNLSRNTSTSMTTEYNAYVLTHSYGNDQYNSIVSQLATANAKIASLTTDNNNLQSDNAELNKIINLQESTIWMNNQVVQQQQNAYVSYTYTATHPGYVYVYVQSTTTNQYIELLWSANGINYDNKITVGSSGTATFPILPSTAQIRIGNTNIINGASATTTITYYY